MTEANYSTGDYYHYTYDSVGNRLTEESKVDGLLSAVDYAYDDSNRLTSVDSVAYTWDANGNLLNDGVNTYTYDSANRLIAVSNQQLASSYQYNGLGDRLSQTVDGNTTNYVLDLNAGLTQVLDDGTSTYLYGNGRISQTGNSTEYFLGDALGSVRQLTNETAEVTLTKSYAPYGEVRSTNGSGQSAFAFTGEAVDANGLVYLRARYYASDTGRFLSRDTWEGSAKLPITYNHWLYVNANPINDIDPTGNISEGMQAKKADIILEKLRTFYNVAIVKDWGYIAQYHISRCCPQMYKRITQMDVTGKKEIGEMLANLS